MNGLSVFGVNIVLHLVARDAEFQGVGRFHRGVEAAPEDNAGDTANHENAPPGIPLGGGPEPFEKARNHLFLWLSLAVGKVDAEYIGGAINENVQKRKIVETKFFWEKWAGTNRLPPDFTD
jgi:hypothetical protein